MHPSSFNLSPKESKKINDILCDAEKRYCTGSSDMKKIEEIDRACQDIWDDWDPSYFRSPIKKPQAEFSTPQTRFSPSIHKKPEITTTPISSSTSSSSSSSVIEEPVQIHEDLSTNSIDDTMPTYQSTTMEDIRSAQTVGKVSKHSKQSSVSTTSRKAPAKKTVPTRFTKKNTQSHITENVRKSTNPIQPFNRTDAAKLRQDNIDLRAQVERLQAALDRSNLENARLKEELHQSETLRGKQKTMIAFLKKEKLYGQK